MKFGVYSDDMQQALTQIRSQLHCRTQNLTCTRHCCNYTTFGVLAIQYSSAATHSDTDNANATVFSFRLTGPFFPEITPGYTGSPIGLPEKNV